MTKMVQLLFVVAGSQGEESVTLGDTVGQRDAGVELDYGLNLLVDQPL